MNTVKNNKIKIMLLAVAVAAINLGVFRAVLLANYIEPETGFYVVETNLDVVFNIAVIAVALGILTCGFMTRKTKISDYLDSKSMVVVFTSALCAFIYFTVAIFGVFKLLNPDIDIFTGAKMPLNYFLFFEVVLAVPCIFNHISICSKEIREKNTPHALLGMSEALFFAVRTVEVFMDMTTQINTSQRSLELVMLCAMMLFFLFEAGTLVKRKEGDISVSKYCIAGLATVALPLVAVLPHLVVSLFVLCFDCDFVIMDVLECSIMLFAASRLLTLRENKQ